MGKSFTVSDSIDSLGNIKSVGEVEVGGLLSAKAGVAATPNTYISGDGLAIRSSGPQQINESLITGIKYQTPYQEIDKTGSSQLFLAVASAEVTEDRQTVFDTTLTSPTVSAITVSKNEIINAIYVKTDGTINNFRFKVKASPSNNIVVSYPDKFQYEDSIGVTLTGAGEHKIDLYYVDTSTPTRFLEGQELELTMNWEDDTGTLLGNSSDDPWYKIDLQEFTMKNLDEVRASGYFNDSGVTTDVCTSGTFYKVDATFTPIEEDSFEFDTINKYWKYTGTLSKYVSISMTFTTDHDDDSTRDITYKIYKNGVAIITPPAYAEIESSDSMNMALLVPALLVEENDYIELYVTADSSSTDVTTSNMNMLIR